MKPAPEKTPLELVDYLDKLNQLADEIHVVWMALQCGTVLDANPNLVCVTEAVNGIWNRMTDTLAEMNGGES